MFRVDIMEFEFSDEFHSWMWTKRSMMISSKEEAETAFGMAVKTVKSRYHEGEYRVEEVSPTLVRVHHGWSSDPEWEECFRDVDEITVICLKEEES